MANDIERPINAGGNLLPEFGSDVVALALRRLGIRYISLNPGASYRGLHDSLVNFLGNNEPTMILCLHEEHAVAIAHAYAKVTGEPMAVAVHSNVGLMHAIMGIFDAWCDRVPVLVLGATGPVDAAKRRPWIDWIHTSRDQGGLIRDFIKFDDQPASAEAAVESIYRANNIIQTIPKGPAYLNFDVTLQEMKLPNPVDVPDPARFAPAEPPRPSSDSVNAAIAALSTAKSPVILAGRVSRNRDDWDRRIELAERLNAVVLTDHKAGASFPTDHPLYAGRVAISSPRANEVIRGADVVLSLDWIDLAGSLSMAWPDEEVGATVINCSSDVHGHNGWTMDHQGMAPVDIHLLADADTSVVSLMDAGVKRDGAPIALSDVETPTLDDAPLRTAHIAHALKAALGDDDFCFVRIGGGWPDGVIKFRGPLDYMGTDGGGGIGSGPGMTVGGALALRDSARIAISILGDGDFSMGMNALWTAAHYSLPMLIIVANNRSYFNDEMHQDRVARIRGREPANRWIGQRITDPELDIVGIAESQGLKGMGPVETLDDLHKVVAEGLDLVRAGAAVVIDARVTPIDSAAAATQVARKT